MSSNLCRLLGLAALFCVAACQLDTRSFRPSKPVLDPRQHCFKNHPLTNDLIQFISDQQTKCFYWECTSSRAVPRQCPLQTFISEFYEGSDYMPCTEIYRNTSLQFDCTRKGYNQAGEATCVQLYRQNDVCKNGGTPVSQGNLCWCQCTNGFSGDKCEFADRQGNTGDDSGEVKQRVNSPVRGSTDFNDDANNKLRMSIRRIIERIPQSVNTNTNTEDEDDDTGPVFPSSPSNPLLSLIPPINAPPLDQRDFNDEGNAASVGPAQVRPPPVVASADANGRFRSGDPCPNGFQKDFCGEHQMINNSNYCFNNGRCVNQCTQAVCICKSPYTAGRRCEAFKCVDNVECMNGGTCRRGPDGQSPVATCQCMAGYSGPMCNVAG